MKQIYTNTTEKVYLRVYKDGVAAATTVDPTYSISVVGSTAAPRTGTAITESTGVYYFTTDLSETEVECVLKVIWDYVVDGDAGQRTDYITVTTPYASLHRQEQLMQK